MESRSNAAVDHNPAYSPDGTKIAFTSTRDGDNEKNRTNNAAYDAEPDWQALP